MEPSEDDARRCSFQHSYIAPGTGWIRDGGWGSERRGVKNEASKRPKVQIVQCVSSFSRAQHLEGKTMFLLVQHIMIKMMMMMITKRVLKESSATIVYDRMDGFFVAPSLMGTYNRTFCRTWPEFFSSLSLIMNIYSSTAYTNSYSIAPSARDQEGGN